MSFSNCVCSNGVSYRSHDCRSSSNSDLCCSTSSCSAYIYVHVCIVQCTYIHMCARHYIPTHFMPQSTLQACMYVCINRMMYSVHSLYRACHISLSNVQYHPLPPVYNIVKYLILHSVCTVAPTEVTYVLQLVHVHERSVIETRQSKATTPEDNSSFSPELPQAGLEPATFCVLGRFSTN